MCSLAPENRLFSGNHLRNGLGRCSSDCYSQHTAFLEVNGLSFDCTMDIARTWSDAAVLLQLPKAATPRLEPEKTVLLLDHGTGSCFLDYS